ncbi:MAG: CbiX/SirB N-terminal domain-containing protein [Candidatus Latescibacteria bacterium]|nr:CbiX/SirB N-terminal domain-containing protein [Candidatus Latescibacterota bacterium]
MKGLLLVAHGSRKKESAEEISGLKQKLRDLSHGEFDVVDHAFLQKASPKFDEKMQEFVSNGISDIMVLPYFLATGSHVASDIPRVIFDIRQKFPNVKIRMLPHIGAAAGMVQLLWDHIHGSKD